MAEKIKICFVRFSEKSKKAYMFEIPTDVYLDKGDNVIVPDADGDPSEAIVVSTETFNFNYESDVAEMDRLLAVSGTQMPFRRVIGTVKREYFKYGDEEVDADGEEN